MEDQPQKPPSRIVGIVILAVAVAGIAFVGYKLMFDPSLNGVSAEANSLQQIQQELADMKERLDQLDKRHKGTAVESPVATSPKTSPDSSGATTRSKPAYQISAASTLSAQRNPNPPVSAARAAIRAGFDRGHERHCRSRILASYHRSLG